MKLMHDVSWGDMHNYLVNSPSEYTHDNLKAYRSLEAFNFFVYNHVRDIYYNEIAKKSLLCSITSKVQKYLFKYFYQKFILVFRRGVLLLKFFVCKETFHENNIFRSSSENVWNYIFYVKTKTVLVHINSSAYIF